MSVFLIAFLIWWVQGWPDADRAAVGDWALAQGVTSAEIAAVLPEGCRLYEDWSIGCVPLY
jgi:hypothetical protein